MRAFSLAAIITAIGSLSVPVHAASAAELAKFVVAQNAETRDKYGAFIYTFTTEYDRRDQVGDKHIKAKFDGERRCPADS